MGFWEGFLILVGLLLFFQVIYNWQKMKMASYGMEEKIVTKNGEDETIWVKAKIEED